MTKRYDHGLRPSFRHRRDRLLPGAAAGILVVVAALMLGCGCEPADRPPTDAGSDLEAVSCSYCAPDGPPPATHRAEIAYEEFLDYELGVGPGPGSDTPQAIFVDQAGVVVFGAWKLLRARLEDGALLSSSDNVGEAYLFAQGPTNYGVVYSVSEGRQFCIIDLAGDVVTCPRTDPASTQIGELMWDGTGYSLFWRSRDRSSYSLITYDASGGLLEERPVQLPPGAWGSRVYAGDTVHFLLSFIRDGTPCMSEHLVALPRSLDASESKTWDLLPEDFVTLSFGRQATNGTRTAALYGGTCFLPRPGAPADEPACVSGWPLPPQGAAFLTIVSQDGTPVEPIRRQVPTSLQPLLWDGARFVMLQQDAGDASNAMVHAFDEEGTFVVWSARLRLGRGGQPTATVIAPVGENDYVAAYKLWDTGETWIARFSLFPL